ncbi:hypothetical protein [Nocardioides sambongensis]|uniref:hypothetical protein n=1 Tax=Nocardioides sambongensis TaxID=2589074 RepID=UPI00112BBBB1|nr:hypothetical protein [Nocardioides sambongensis]
MAGVRSVSRGSRAVVVLLTGLLLVGTGATAAPAGATSTSTSSASAPLCDGVAVLVDAGGLGGADTVACVAETGAAAAFDAAGVGLEFLPQQPGFVCRVAGRPAEGPCFDGDAYWSLWWSDGSHGWTYATLGVTALEIPAGGAVAFAWHQGEGSASAPDLAVPELRESAGTTPGTGASTGAGEAEGAGAADGSAEVTASASSSPDDTAAAADGSGLSVWVVALLVGLVLLAALVPIVRRRSG